MMCPVESDVVLDDVLLHLGLGHVTGAHRGHDGRSVIAVLLQERAHTSVPLGGDAFWSSFDFAAVVRHPVPIPHCEDLYGVALRPESLRAAGALCSAVSVGESDQAVDGTLVVVSCSAVLISIVGIGVAGPAFRPRRAAVGVIGLVFIAIPPVHHLVKRRRYFGASCHV